MIRIDGVRLRVGPSLSRRFHAPLRKPFGVRITRRILKIRQSVERYVVQGALDDPLADVDEAEVAVARGPGVDDRNFAFLNIAALVGAEGIGSRARRVDVRGEQDSHPRSLQEAERILRAVHEGERRQVTHDSAAVEER